MTALPPDSAIPDAVRDALRVTPGDDRLDAIRDAAPTHASFALDASPRPVGADAGQADPAPDVPAQHQDSAGQPDADMRQI